MSPDKASSSPGVKSALRTLDLIEYVVAQPSGVAANEAAAALGIPVSSLSYLLATLVERTYLRREGRRYVAGPGLDRLRRPQAETSLADRARPLIKALGNQLNETTSLFVRTGWEMEAVVTETSNQNLRYAIEVGTRTPLHCVAAGKALLASLSDDDLKAYFAETKRERFTDATIVGQAPLMRELIRVRESRIAYTRDEYTIGMTGVGTAVVQDGVAVAAIGVAAPSQRFSKELEARIIEQILKTANVLGSG